MSEGSSVESFVAARILGQTVLSYSLEQLVLAIGKQHMENDPCCAGQLCRLPGYSTPASPREAQQRLYDNQVFAHCFCRNLVELVLYMYGMNAFAKCVPMRAQNLWLPR